MRIARANAFADLMSFFGTHVLAIGRGCALPTENATFVPGKRRRENNRRVQVLWMHFFLANQENARRNMTEGK
jgi:hypothetical protein